MLSVTDNKQENTDKQLLISKCCVVNQGIQIWNDGEWIHLISSSGKLSLGKCCIKEEILHVHSWKLFNSNNRQNTERMGLGEKVEEDIWSSDEVGTE